MDKIKREKYILAVYISIFMISIVLTIIGIQLDSGDIKDIILNIQLN
jgi:uncharacterized membrane protein